ncbi:Response regulator receiver domain-containing protein [Rhizobium sp. RU20A]|uniref:response regulator n=1 Tax=Rhizobium sp. RU20A TaxID=1907412 RepID=UPI000955801A|nr:response regulator [Rhizobium sp. RU20A]SIR17598.1 Response regulator receiver domain-containing protein [Rhizobium sp. RU20A]
MKIRSILVVDDDENDQFICEYTIHRYDPEIAVLKAYNGQEALALLRTTTPSAIILDINMPIMNGFEFLDHYAREFQVHAPVVAMLTSSHLDADRQRALEYRFVRSFFQKPLKQQDIAVMAQVLEEEIGGRG